MSAKQNTRWCDVFADLDRSPWPGPRPITQDPKDPKDSHSTPSTTPNDWLKAREVEGEAFLAAVLDHLLVVLTADSGVGKTSLLQSSLLANLDCEGFRPVYIDQWDLETDEKPEVFVARKVADALPDTDLPKPSDGRFWSEVDARHGDRLVLVLDQFEELVRFQATLFAETRKWITELNQRQGIRVVLSLRAEFVHQLRDLERAARPFTFTTFRLEPIDRDADIKRIITGYDDAVEGGLSSGAAKLVLGLWQNRHIAGEPRGLLHLQGLLYALHHRSTTDDGEIRPISAKEVERLEADAAAEGVDPLAYSLQEAVRIKIAHCRRAAIASGFDRILVDGTEALVHRIVPDLSSGGFKLVLDEWQVAQRALDNEMTQRTPLSDDEKRALYDLSRAITAETLDKILHEPWPSNAPSPERPQLGRLHQAGRRAAGDRPTIPEYDHLDWVPWHHDPDEVSSGPMLGMPPTMVLHQEMRRFAFAMAWLEAASLVRRSRPKDNTTMVALIHDGFGPALERGIGSGQDRFDHLMARVTAPNGELITWTETSFASYRDRVMGADDGPVLPLVNVRWRDCTVRDATFEDVVLVNCDLRGTRFEQCTFIGATFVNCLLDNASFIGCEIKGAPAAAMPSGKTDVLTATKHGDRDLPDFRVEVPKPEAQLLATYRDTDRATGGLIYSRTSGVAAHPARGATRKRGIEWEPARGGLAMFGGRLSSLMILGGSFVRHQRRSGTLSLRHIAGASLDLVELSGGRVQIVDSTIRGITITSPVTTHPTGSGRTTLDVVTAVLGNLWFGAGLEGQATLTDCQAIQVLNLNDAKAFAVRADIDRQETISVGMIDSLAALDEAFAGATRSGTARPPVDDLQKMDFRSEPAQHELDP